MVQKIQIAFQGGGARLAVLMAAATAVLDLKRQGKIDVTAVAGTSAGSVAAALVAKDADMEGLREFLITKGKHRIAEAFPPLPEKLLSTEGLGAVLRGLRGKTYASDKTFFEFIRDSLEAGGISGTETVGSAPPLSIVIADTKKNRQHVAQPDENLADALVHSCALPFYFKGAKSVNQRHLIDGGLFNNLPASRLSLDFDEYGPILCFSFEEDGPNIYDESPKAFLKNLVGAIISEKVNEAIAYVGKDNVILLDNSLKTFDVVRIPDYLSGEKWAANRQFARTQTEKWLQGIPQDNDHVRRPKKDLEYIKSIEEFALNVAVREQIASKIRVSFWDTVVTARSLDESIGTSLDEMQTHFTLNLADNPNFRYLVLKSIHIADGGLSDFVIEMSLDGAPFEEFTWTHIPDDTLRSLTAIVMVDPEKLSDGKTLRITVKQHITDFFTDLQSEVANAFHCLIVENFFRVDRHRISFIIPDSFGRIALSNEKTAKFDETCPEKYKQWKYIKGTVGADELGYIPMDHTVYQWYFEGLDRGSVARVTLHRL